jgi:hypothetical protein
MTRASLEKIQSCPCKTRARFNDNARDTGFNVQRPTPINREQALNNLLIPSATEGDRQTVVLSAQIAPVIELNYHGLAAVSVNRANPP